jgi:MFS family permease
MITALLIGISYGFAAGVSAGPLLGLVITQTLQGGWRAGNLVALAPLLSDLPIILLAQPTPLPVLGDSRRPAIADRVLSRFLPAGQKSGRDQSESVL